MVVIAESIGPGSHIGSYKTIEREIYPSLPILDTQNFLRAIGADWENLNTIENGENARVGLIEPWISFLGKAKDGLLSVADAIDNNKVKGSSENVRYWLILKDCLLKYHMLEDDAKTRILIANKNISIEGMKNLADTPTDFDVWGVISSIQRAFIELSPKKFKNDIPEEIMQIPVNTQAKHRVAQLVEYFDSNMSYIPSADND